MMALFGAVLIVVAFLLVWESEKMIQEKKERK